MKEWFASGWLNTLIDLLQWTQLTLLRLLDALGLVGRQHGQPAWPWPERLSGENLLIDPGQARRLGWTVLLLSLVLLLLVASLAWRRRRIWLSAIALVLLAFVPWPERSVALVPAYPTSFSESATSFSARSIAHGQQLYAAHCVECHGAKGDGQGPLAAGLPVWPPNLDGPLLWRRADGDLFWHILHGIQDRHGVRTMPAFGARLDADDAWSLIDFMKAQGAGQTLLAAGFWANPVKLPDMRVRCDGRPLRLLSQWHGQRVRIVAEDGGKAPLEDPRLVTVVLRAPGAPMASTVTHPTGRSDDGAASVDCSSDDADAWQALALLTGNAELAGSQLLADRDGWLRATQAPGKGAWSDDDLLCRGEGNPAASVKSLPGVDGLSSLISSMDAEPVRFVKGGFVH